MYKALAAILVFVVGIGFSMVFQNCGGSSLEAKSSNEGGLPVEVVNEDGTTNTNSDDDDNTSTGGDGTGGDGTGGDGTGGDGTGGDDDDSSTPGVPGPTGFRFAFSSASPENNIFFITGGGLSLDLATSRLMIKSYYFVNEIHIYEQNGVTFTRDLPTSFCANSALPHCAHLTTAPCIGLGCFKTPTPVRCHWQKRLNSSQESNFINAFGELRLLNREVSDTDPMMLDCNDPKLQFHSETPIFGSEISSLEISLANRSCVNDGEYYAMDSTGGNITNRFLNEIELVKNRTDNSGGSEFCNNYSTYAWDTTKFEYKSHSGFVQPQDAYSYNVTYENQKVNMRFKEKGNPEFLCATGVPVQNIEVAVLFPDDGISYEILRTTVAIADLSTAEISYEDPVDGGGKWRFFLDRGSALTESGGAIMNTTSADAIKNLIEVVLARRAKLEGAPWMATTCPNN